MGPLSSQPQFDPGPRPYFGDDPRPTEYADDALERVKGIFLEMPGTERTGADAARLTGLDGSVCRTILDALEQARFLSRRSNGAFLLGNPQPHRRGDDSDRRRDM